MQNLQGQQFFQCMKIFLNPPAVTVHILHDNTLTQDNHEKFIYLAERYGQIIKFYNVEKLLPEHVQRVKNKAEKYYLKNWSITGPFRLMVGNLLSKDIEKLIYLDADLIVNLDINELWQVQLGDSPFASVREDANQKYDVVVNRPICRDGFVNPKQYLNVGVMLMNLKRFREEEENIWKGVDFVIAHKYNPFDQETLNFCFSNQAISLPKKFNVWVKTQQRFVNTPIEKKIYHYLSRGMSLGADVRDNYNRLYWYYFCKTPWFNEDTLGKIFDGVRELYVERQDLMTRISAIISGKSRAFVTMSQNVDALKKIFYVNESEEIFQIDSSDWLPKLANTMKNSFGKKIFIILAGEIYSQLREILAQAGFIEGRDFINGEIFFSELHGAPLDLYPLIMRM